MRAAGDVSYDVGHCASTACLPVIICHCKCWETCFLELFCLRRRDWGYDVAGHNAEGLSSLHYTSVFPKPFPPVNCQRVDCEQEHNLHSPVGLMEP